MNGYSQLLYYLRQLAKPHANTVTQGDFTKVDLNKQNIFPLVHINVGGASFPSGSVVRFNVEIGCFDIRDINKEVNTDKYFENDNEVDNMNATMAILNRMWQMMYKDFEENNITAASDPSLTIHTEENTNLLDGWIMTIAIEVPNTDINLCQV